ncbi:MAG: ATP-binding protein [Planctomycetaceae bacterium]
MISYRALKKLIGETSLERKCRFLFGIALLFLITASFWWYASRTRRLVEYQQLISARTMVTRLLQQRHYAKFLERSERKRLLGTASAPSTTNEPVPAPASTESPPEPAATNPPEPPAGSEASVSDSSPTASDGTDVVAAADLKAPAEPAAASEKADLRIPYMEQLRRTLDSLPSASDRFKWSITDVNVIPGNDQDFDAREKFLDTEGTEDEYWMIRDEEDGSRTLLYYTALRIETACRVCHLDNGKMADESEIENLLLAEATKEKTNAQKESAAGEATGVAASEPETAETPESQEINRRQFPLRGIARMELSLESVDAQLARNRAVLLATGIVTSFLAMLAAYAIVRYIIVKPVLHLKDVSDEIARGNLNLRADISTGDEFEELSHAFNRMLRHMMTVNDELRTLNESLDGKIDQLAQANMELFNNNRLKDDFLATISHELRTPLNSILGFSDILQTAANLDDRQKRYVHNIQTSGQSLMVQINDLLDLAKIESGKMELHPDRVDLAEILEVQVQQIMPLADRKNIDLRIEPPPQALPLLYQDRSKISQIVTNLLSNAIKFTPEGGRVRVASKLLDADSVGFSVEDTGIGIPLQEQEHIFEKFRQGTTAPGGRDHTKREYEGTGLGLSIVRELSRLLGGDVSLISEFGRGSLFSVRIPLRVPERRIEPEPPLESRSSPNLPLITSSDLLNAAGERQVASGSASKLKVEVHSIGHP